MNHGLTDVTADRIRGVLARYSEVKKAVLYGSRAKGNYKNGSDIDLTLFGHDLDLSLLAKISTALDDLLLPYKIDISIFAQLTHPELIDHIRRVGIVFYEKQAASVKSA
jgi:predicted nucleotidyltransferase